MRSSSSTVISGVVAVVIAFIALHPIMAKGAPKRQFVTSEEMALDAKRHHKIATDPVLSRSVQPFARTPAVATGAGLSVTSKAVCDVNVSTPSGNTGKAPPVCVLDTVRTASHSFLR